MAFPQQQLNLKTEVYLGATLGWVDITADVRLSTAHSGGGVGITRGRGDWASQVDPSVCNLTLNNRHGKWSARNPRSPYYRLLSRNSPIRFSLPDLPLTPYLEYADTGSNRLVSTPDVAALDITGDIDIRLDFQLDRVYVTGEEPGLANKYDGGAGSRSWAFTLVDGRYPAFYWSPDGTLPNRRSATSNAAWTQTTDRVAMRATLTVNNGASGCTARFYTAPTMAGPWTQLGTDVIQAGTTSVFAGTAPVDLGTSFGAGVYPPATNIVPIRGRLYKFELRNGINGTAVANPDFTAQVPGTTSWTDAAGRVWTIGRTTVRFVDERYRFYGEVPAWPPRWDLSQHDRWVPLEAAGILRRLGQGNAPISSPIYRTLKQRGPVTYLPLEDGTDTTVPTLDVGVGMATAVDVSFGAGDVLAGARQTAKFNSASSSISVPTNMAGSGETNVVWYFKMGGAPPSDRPMMTLNMAGGTAAQWVVNIGTAGYSISATDWSGTQLTSGAWLWPTDPTTNWIGLQFATWQSGGNTNWELNWLNVGDQGGVYNESGNFVGTVGRPSVLTLAPAGVGGTSLSNAAVYDGPFSVDSVWFKTSAGNNAEYAADRMSRLASENGVPFYLTGRIDETVTMGPQRSMTFLELMREAAAADGGILYEARETLGLVYRTRASMYDQVPVSIPFGQVSEPFDPVDDDQQVRNQITVTRVNGGSATATLSTGSLSTQAPPNGVGAYQDSAELNVQSDTTLPGQAWWRLHLGTVDELRHPSVHVDLSAPAWATNQTLTAQAAAVDSGDLVRVTALPDWVPTNAVKTLIQGYTETLDAFDWDITWTATPGGAWDVARAVDGSQRIPAEGATLTAGITSSATSLQITSPNTQWTTDPTFYPLDINVGGEQITLSGMTGSSSPYTGTVVARAVNGVSKSHVAGETVNVWSPAIAAL